MTCEHHWHDQGVYEICCECNAHKCEAIQRVRELHKPIKETNKNGYVNIVCSGCYDEDSSTGEQFHHDYPCPTIKALDGDSDA